MIVPKRGFKKRYAYGGSGIFDTIASLLTRIFTSGAAKQIASSAMDVAEWILQKYTTPKPATQDINSLIDGSAIAVQDLVRKLNSGAGIKKI